MAATATAITATGTHYVMTVKGNRKRLQAACAAAFTRHADTATHDLQVDRGHARTEERIVSAVQVTPADGIDFPGAAQIVRIVRYTGGLDGQRTTKEVVYAITALTRDQADASVLSVLARGHWQIEALHRSPETLRRSKTLPARCVVGRGVGSARKRLSSF